MLPFISVKCVEKTPLLSGPAEGSLGVPPWAYCPELLSTVSKFWCPQSVLLWKGLISSVSSFSC